MSLNPIKLVTIVGTRPEIIRLSRIIDRLNNSDSFSHTLVHTGQNYDYNLNDIFFKDLSISKPDIYLDASSENSSKTIRFWSSLISKRFLATIFNFTF